jgi:hypothetical protein
MFESLSAWERVSVRAIVHAGNIIFFSVLRLRNRDSKKIISQKLITFYQRSHSTASGIKTQAEATSLGFAKHFYE